MPESSRGSHRLILPMRTGERVRPFELAPSCRIESRAVIALPTDLDAWRDRAIGTATIVSIQHLRADAGWPFTLVHTRHPTPADPSRVLLALFEVFDRGIVVTAAFSDAMQVAEHHDRLLATLRAADIDRQQREAVAIAQIWEDV